MIRDVLAVVDVEDRDDAFLADALAFADFHEAHLTFLLLSPVPTPDYVLTLAPPYILLDEWVKHTEDKKARVEALTRRRACEIRVISDDPVELLRKVPVHARYADIALFGPPSAYASHRLRQKALEAVMFSSGRPLLTLPAGYAPRQFAHLALGWNASREATRALKDATSFLSPGARIDVLVVDGAPQVLGHGSEPGADITHHLARHGYDVTLHEQPSCGTDVAEVLTSLARRRMADFLAIGGYAHSRLRELVLGGVTTSLIRESPMPCLFAH